MCAKCDRSLSDNLRLALQWIDDLDAGEMIQTMNYTKEFLGFPSISQFHLTVISRILNIVLLERNSKWTTRDSMGEIVSLLRE